MSRRGFAEARALAPTEEEWGARLVDLYAQTLACAASGSARTTAAKSAQGGRKPGEEPVRALLRPDRAAL
jgi:hypothetical protein